LALKHFVRVCSSLSPTPADQLCHHRRRRQAAEQPQQPVDFSSAEDRQAFVRVLSETLQAGLEAV